MTPPSPDALVSGDGKRPVKQMLREFNAQRILSRVVKGTHRRISGVSIGELHPDESSR